MHRVSLRNLTLLLFMFALVASATASAAGQRGLAAASQPASGWRLVFEDEFSGSTLDTGAWITAFPWGRDRSNLGELQHYAPEAFALNRGNLKIIAEPTAREGSDYTSGLISSHASLTQEFGRFEIRARLPRGQGLWPAFWLLPEDGSWPPEIDVFEALGHETETVHMTAHWRDDGVHRQQKASYTGPDFSEDFHTFAVEWSEHVLVWYVDGVKRHEVRGETPRGPMYLLANLAVGGEWPGPPDASTPFPAVFAIDYIRAYEPAPAPMLSAYQRTESNTRVHRRMLTVRRLRQTARNRGRKPAR